MPYSCGLSYSSNSTNQRSLALCFESTFGIKDSENHRQRNTSFHGIPDTLYTPRDTHSEYQIVSRFFDRVYAIASIRKAPRRVSNTNDYISYDTPIFRQFFSSIRFNRKMKIILGKSFQLRTSIWRRRHTYEIRNALILQWLQLSGQH